MASCEDPMVRRPMSLLEAVFIGPEYASFQYEHAKERFSNVVEKLPSQNQSLSNEELPSEKEFLWALVFEARMNMAENLLNLAWPLRGQTGFGTVSTLFKSDPFKMVNMVTHYVCGSGCPSEDRAKIKQSLLERVQYLERSNPAAINIHDIQTELKTLQSAFVQILSSKHTDNESEKALDYYTHLNLMTASGFGQLLKMKAIGSPISEGICESLLLCARYWRTLEITERKLKYAVIEMFEMTRLAASSLGHMKQNSDSISMFYRLSPATVARAFVREPRLTPLHCTYLPLALKFRGQRSTEIEMVNAAVYLGPLTAFWALGTGVPTFFGPLFKINGQRNAFAASHFGIGKAIMMVAAVTVIDTIWRTHNINRQNQELRKLLYLNTNDLMVLDEQSFSKYLMLKESVNDDSEELQKILIYEGVSMLAGGLVGRALSYGVKNIFRKFDDLDEIFKRLRSGRGGDRLLDSIGIRSSQDLALWLKTASKKEIRDLMKPIQNDYSAFALLSLKEVADAFYVYPYLMRPSTGSAEDRVY